MSATPPPVGPPVGLSLATVPVDPAPSREQAAPSAARQRLAALLADAHRQPWAHDFFALLRQVEAQADAPRIGAARRPGQELLRLGQDAELDFASAALTTLELDRPQAPRLGVRFFGLLGPQGPLPLHLTEWVRERQHNLGDDTAARFLDLFHHRLLSLFYRAWADHQPTVQHDRPTQDRYAAWLGALVGLDAPRVAPGQSDAAALPDLAQLHQVGLLASRSRHPEGLCRLLQRHFGVAVQVVEHVEHWLTLEDEDRTRLGSGHRAPGRAPHRAADPGGGNGGNGAALPTWPAARLGIDTVLGARRRDRQFKFRLVLGPLGLGDYLAFLPGGARAATLADWVQRYVGADLQWDVALRLAGDQLPAPRLGSAIALGQTAWLRRPQPRDEAGAPPSPLQPVQPADRSDLHLTPRRLRQPRPGRSVGPAHPTPFRSPSP